MNFIFQDRVAARLRSYLLFKIPMGYSEHDALVALQMHDIDDDHLRVS